MSKEILIINNFINNEEARDISYFFRKTVVLNDHTPNSFPSRIGFENSKKASLISPNNPIIRIGQDEEENYISQLTTKIILEVKEKSEIFFKKKLDLVHFTYHVMCPGAINGLHSDSTTLDGKPNRDDGIPEEQEYSALIYFNNHGNDYEGGEIEFPLQDLVLRPKSGDLIIFRGNHLYPHKVNRIKRGMRDTMVIFFGSAGNVSERTITSFVD